MNEILRAVVRLETKNHSHSANLQTLVIPIDGKLKHARTAHIMQGGSLDAKCNKQTSLSEICNASDRASVICRVANKPPCCYRSICPASHGNGSGILYLLRVCIGPQQTPIRPV